ncbi:MAG: class I SAM-dependent methyltransferase [Rhodospirillaceae bacterium]
MAVDKAGILGLTGPQLDEMTRLLRKYPREFLHSPTCRQFLAKARFEKNKRAVTVHEDTSTGVMPGTVSHNLIQIDDGTFASSARTARLINPIASLDSVYFHAARLQVLSIGPRTEMELMHLVAAGFQPENISAVDLISTSAWIDLGDMHALPYEDRSFDVTLSSWVLGYSRDPQKAVDEMVRVTRDGGIIAIGCTYNADARNVDYKGEQDKIVGTIFRHVEQYRTLMGPALSRVHFQEEPEADHISGAVMIVGRIRHTSA